MARNFSRSRSPMGGSLRQPRNSRFTQRVQAVGPEHFGIVSIDCAKATSSYMLSNFFGQILLQPTVLPHTRGDLDAACQRIRQAMAEHDLRDLVIAIERTGEYHRPVQRAFQHAGWDVRLVHSYATKHYRQPGSSGNKTDGIDLDAIFRLTIDGFGRTDVDLPDDYQQLFLLRRHRRTLVKHTTRLRCQILEQLHMAMPGFANCFGKIWESLGPWAVARATGSAATVLQAGTEGLVQIIRAAGVGVQKRTVNKILAWAQNAPPGHPQAQCLRRIFTTNYHDLRENERKIRDLERDLAHLVVGTPYVLLLAIPGINIVSCADFAGELGPITLYHNANAITGRAALMPCRYQSDQVDCSGPLRRSGNRRIRGVLMQIADNLVRHNHHFRARADIWLRSGKKPRWLRVKIAKIFSRLAFAIVAGRQLSRHPCLLQRCYILDKILKFHSEHDTPLSLMQQDLELASDQLTTPRLRREEAEPLARLLDQLGTRRGPQPLAAILPLVLARLGDQRLQLDGGEQDLS